MRMLLPCTHKERAVWTYLKIGGDATNLTINWCPSCGALQEVWDGTERPWLMPEQAREQPMGVA